ncbi:hypothetical protein MHB77_31560 [Paenibacillus sp. FSL K6-3166]|uniref:hypothetical protein n=1 Tax=Paenibacillus sp. FSL K6-3166 TaxID=2921492 RepID=UPI0030FCE894
MDNRPKFNHQRFLKNLMEKAKQPPPRLQTAGVYYIIEAFFNGDADAAEINFESFTLQDVQNCFEIADSLSSVEDEDYYSYGAENDFIQDKLGKFKRNWVNPIYQFVDVIEKSGVLLKLENKIFSPTDDFI